MPPSLKKEADMNRVERNEQRVETLKEHIEEHPTDYQAVIGLLKANSDLIESRLHSRKIEKLKRVAHYRREYEKQTFE